MASLLLLRRPDGVATRLAVPSVAKPAAPINRTVHAPKAPAAGALSADQRRDMVLGGTEASFSATAGTYAAVARGARRVEDAEVTALLTQLVSLLEGQQQANQGRPALLPALRTGFLQAVDAVVAASAETTKRTIAEVYIAHDKELPPWALPRDPAAGTLGDALPVAQRESIRIITDPANVSEEEFFSNDRAVTHVALPNGIDKAKFAGQISDSLKPGLTAVAGKLAGADGSKPGLVANSTLTLILNLAPYGGENAVFRFTYVVPKGTSSGPSILIERLGAVGESAAAKPEGVLRAQEAALAAKFQAHQFSRRNVWSDSERHAVLAAVALVPDSELGPIDGVTFAREAKDSDPANADATGGKYDRVTHTIFIYDLAFKDPTLERNGLADQTRFGGPGAERGLTSPAVRAVLHEIGHAIDLAPLRKADQTSAGGLMALEKYRNKKGTFDFPATAEGHADNVKFDALKAALRRAEVTTKSLSGTGEKPDPKDPETIVDELSPPGAASNAFRVAVAADGHRRVTEYSAKDFQEAFAEAFSLFTADPESLRRLRPKVFAYLTKTLGSKAGSGTAK